KNTTTATATRMMASTNPPISSWAVRSCSGRGRVMPKVLMKASISQARSFMVLYGSPAHTYPHGPAPASQAALRDGIKHAVKKIDGFGSRIAAGDFQGFVDHDGSGRSRKAEQLGDRHPQQIAVDRGHSFDAPVFGILLEHRIDLRAARCGDAKQILG